jgi:hypothetical protein
MLVRGKISDTQNNSLTVDISKEENLDDHKTDDKTDTILRQKQVIYWPDFVTRRRRRRPVEVTVKTLDYEACIAEYRHCETLPTHYTLPLPPTS